MASNPTTDHHEKLRHGGAAVKEGGRIIATIFLSLLLPLSFLLLSRLSTSRHSSSTINNDHKVSIFTSLFLQSKITLILSLLIFAVAIEALVQCLKGSNKPTFFSKRHRLYAAWVLLFLMQICLSLGIHATVDGGDIAGEKLMSPRKVVFVLGLHEITVVWRRSVVAPVVVETMFGGSVMGSSWVEEVMLVVAFGDLWWRRVREEAEGLVAPPWVAAELEVANWVGWLLYYLTSVLGGVRVIRGLSWATMRIFELRCRLKKGVNTAVNLPV